MEKDKFNMHGAVLLTLRKADGSVTTTRRNNMILDSGIDWLCDFFATGALNYMNNIALGTGTTEVTADDTALENQIITKVAKYSHVRKTSKFTMSATFAAGEATGAITEAGIHNDANSDGVVFFDRVVFPVINKGESDMLTVTFEITLSRV